jgi:hypothetical protein
VDEFREDVKKAGITGVDINNDGSVTFSCRSARRKYMEHRGVYDRDAGYGDHAPNNF